MRKLAALLVLAGTTIGPSAQGRYPSHTISNGQIDALIYLPDARSGFYRSTRFDWSGMIGSLKYKGHEFYAPWFHRIGDVYDLAYEGQEIVSAPFTAAVGPAEEFYTGNSGLGYAEAPVGGTFIKIGVGVLKKAQEPRYDHSSAYEIVDAGKWMVKTAKEAVELTHDLRDPSTGYAYSYTKVVRLAPGRPEMTIAHRLRNTGTKAIATNVYNHNFVVLDRQPIGPDFVVKFPFPLVPGARGRGPAPTGAAPGASVPAAAAAPSPVPGARVVLNNADASCRAENSCAPVGELVGTELRYTKVLEGRERMSTGIGGFSNEVKDYDIRVENAKVGVGFRLTADTPPLARRVLVDSNGDGRRALQRNDDPAGRRTRVDPDVHVLRSAIARRRSRSDQGPIRRRGMGVANAMGLCLVAGFVGLVAQVQARTLDIY